MFKKSVSLAILMCFCLVSMVFVPAASADVATTLAAAKGICDDGYTAYVTGVMEGAVIAGPDFDIVAQLTADAIGADYFEVKAEMESALDDESLLAGWDIPAEDYDDFYPTVEEYLPNAEENALDAAVITIDNTVNTAGNVGEGLLYAAAKNAKFAGKTVKAVTVSLTDNASFTAKLNSADLAKVAANGVETVEVVSEDYVAAVKTAAGATQVAISKTGIPSKVTSVTGSNVVYNVTVDAENAVTVTVPAGDKVSKVYKVEADGTYAQVAGVAVSGGKATFPVAASGYYALTDSNGLGGGSTPGPGNTPGKDDDDDKKDNTTNNNNYYTGNVGPIIPVGKDFNDLPKSHWAYKYVMPLVNDEILAGVGDNLFDPDGNVTREQFAKMIVVSFGLKLADGNGDFADVDANAWYAPYIQTAKNAGVVKGISDTEFGVGMNITRQDMATMLNRAVNAVGIKMMAQAPAAAFADQDQIADYAFDSVMAMQVAGVIQGRGGNEFAPLANATRAEAAKMIYVIYYGTNE